jgi:hypothetical protein
MGKHGRLKGMTKREILALAKAAHDRGDWEYRDILMTMADKMRGNTVTAQDERGAGSR